MDWNGKTVFLTGASSGIGEALAVVLAKKGAVLGLVARRKELLDELKEKCEVAGGTARVFACDVVDAEALQKAADEFRDEFQHIDIMIANAGVGGNDAATRSYEPVSVKKLIDINLLGSANAVYAVAAKMIERGSGHIVGISSLAGFRGHAIESWFIAVQDRNRETLASRNGAHGVFLQF